MLMTVYVPLDGCKDIVTSFTSREALAIRCNERPGRQCLTIFEASSRQEAEAWKRLRAEEFIGSHYQRYFGSTLESHYPIIAGIWHANDGLSAAVGVRAASNGKLYLEQYLDRPIEAALSQIAGEPVARSGVVEIGNFVSTGRGVTEVFIAAVAHYLVEQGFEYVVVTATRRLRQSLAALGIQWTRLGAADPGRLPDHGRSWGRYYQHDPHIIFGQIIQALPALGAPPSNAVASA
jgi:hypothetical protein